MVIGHADIAGAEIAILGKRGFLALSADDLLTMGDGGFDEDFALGFALFAVDLHLHAVEGASDGAFHALLDAGRHIDADDADLGHAEAVIEVVAQTIDQSLRLRREEATAGDAVTDVFAEDLLLESVHRDFARGETGFALGDLMGVIGDHLGDEVALGGL